MSPHIPPFLDYMQYERRASPLTIQADQRDLQNFETFLSSTTNITDLTQVTPKNVRRWMVTLLDSDIAPRSVNRMVAALRSFYRFLCQRDIVKINPCKVIDSVKTPKKLPVFLHDDEMLNIVDPVNYPDTFIGHRDRTIVQLFYLTGIRRAELVNMTVGQIDMATQQILVNGKRNKQRIIPVTKFLNSIISSYLHHRENEFGTPLPTDPLFLTAKGKPIYPQLVYQIVHDHIQLAANATKMSPHVLRHTFATAMLNHGADLMAIKELLGHTSLSATQIYAHSDFEQLNNIYKKAHPRAHN